MKIKTKCGGRFGGGGGVRVGGQVGGGGGSGWM